MTQIRMRCVLWAANAAASLSLTACDPGPASKGPQPAAIEAGLVDDLPPKGAKAVFYKFGPPESRVGFTAAKITNKHDGSFKVFEGTIGLVANDPRMSAVQASIDLGSVTTDSEKLSTHLKSADFFDVAKFPKATFHSTTIRPGNAPTSFNVTGKLDLHGVTKPLTFPATIRLTADTVDCDGEIKLNRKDFGIVYPGMPDDLISDEVAIKLTIRAKPAAKEVAPGAASAATPAGHKGD